MAIPLPAGARLVEDEVPLPAGAEYEGWESDARGYGFEKGTSLLKYGVNIAQSKFPNILPGIKYKSKIIDGEEIYFSDLNQPMDSTTAERQNKRYNEFHALKSYDERREYLKQQNLDDASESYPNLTDEMKKSGNALGGEVVGSLMDPTILIGGPVAWLATGSLALKAAKFGAMSGLWGGTYSAAQQAAEEGSIDPVRLVKDTALATVGGTVLRGSAPLVWKGIKGGGNLTGKGVVKVINKTEKAVGKLILKDKANISAVEFMRDANVRAAEIIRNNAGKNYYDIKGVFNKSGVIDHKVFTRVIKDDLIKEAKLTPQQFKTMEREAGIQFKVPTNQTNAGEYISQLRYDKYTDDTKNPFKHKILQLISGKIVTTGRDIETMVSPAYEKLKDAAPKWATKLIRMDFNILTKANRIEKDIAYFRKQIKNLTPEQTQLVKKHLSNSDVPSAIKVLGNDIGYHNVRKILDRLRDESIKSGNKLNKIEAFFPRVIKKHQSYLNKLNAKFREQNSKQVLTEFDGIKKDLKRKIMIKRGGNVTTDGKKIAVKITDEELTNELNKYILNGSNRPIARQLKLIDESLIDEYMDPMEALESYIASSINKTEKTKFLGKYARFSDEGDANGNQFLEESIGNLGDDIALGDRVGDVTKVLRARLINGQQGSGYMQFFKNFDYMTLLANPSAAAMQGADVGFSIAQNGMYRSTKNLLKQMGRQKFGDKLKYNIDEIGLGKVVSAEMGGTKKGTDKAVNDLFEISQFTRMDRTGKTTHINSSLDKAMDVVMLNSKAKLKNPKAYEKFRQEWEGILGKNGFTNMVAAMRTGRKNDDVGFYLFTELSKVQPISLSQMPVGYLNAKNGKIWYTLKSFALKQLDFARRKILTNLVRKEYKEAFKNTLVLSATLGGSQTIVKQLQKLLALSPEEIKIEDMPYEFVETLANGLFLNKYTRGKLIDSYDYEGVIISQATPPLTFFAVMQDISLYLDSKGEKNPEEMMREMVDPFIPFEHTRQLIPFGGKIYSEQTVKKPKRRKKELRELMKGLNLYD